MRQSLAVFAILLFMSACGGGGTSSIPDDAVSPPPPAAVLKSTSKTVSQSDPIVDLAGIARVDVTGLRELDGATVTVAQAQSSEITDAAESLRGGLSAEFSPAKLIRVSLSKMPTAPVAFRAFDGDVVQGADQDQFPAIFAIQLVDTQPGGDADGGPIMQVLPGLSSTQDNSISASIPPTYFQASQNEFVAYLLVGSTTIDRSLITSGSSANRILRPLPQGVAGQLDLPCPFGPSAPRPPIPDSQPSIVVPNACVERSRFNTVRYLNSQARNPHSHLGMDLVADKGTATYVPEGGQPIASMTRGRSAPGTGITLALDYGSYRIRLLHLSRISDDLIDANGNARTSAITARGSAVAWTGDTGIPGQPHLHYEVLIPTGEICKIRQSGRMCGPAWSQVDPFPLMVSRILISEATNSWYLQRGAHFQFILRAIDDAGAEIASDVHNAFENGGNAPRSSQARIPYDPTRKVCILVGQSSAQAPSVDSVVTFRGIGGYVCRPWGRSLDVLGVSSLPPAELTFRFSSDASKSLASDPLSAAFENFSIAREMSHCLSLDLIWVGDICTIFGGVATQNAADVSRVTMRSDNPAIATTSVGLSPTRGPPYLIELSVIAGSVRGQTNVHYFIDGRLQDTFSVTNQARTD